MGESNQRHQNTTHTQPSPALPIIVDAAACVCVYVGVGHTYTTLHTTRQTDKQTAGVGVCWSQVI